MQLLTKRMNNQNHIELLLPPGRGDERGGRGGGGGAWVHWCLPPLPDSLLGEA